MSWQLRFHMGRDDEHGLLWLSARGREQYCPFGFIHLFDGVEANLLGGYSVKSRRHVAVLAFVVAFLVAGWLSKRLDLSTVFCPLCWQESLWIAWKWVNAKLLQRPQEAHRIVRHCESNLIQIADIILKDYAPKHNGFLPDQESWQQWAGKSLKNLQVLRCSAAKPSEKVSYRLNPTLSGKRLKDIKALRKTVLLFE